MNKFLLLMALSAGLALPVCAESVQLQGKSYEVEVKTDREIGPGIRHTRFRLPAYPLNINVLRVDLTNSYNRIETTVANESAKGTEGLVHAAERQSKEGHRALAGANANFWVVATQPEENTYTGTTRNASIRNGKMVTESNQHRDQWDGGTMRTGVVAMSYDKTAYIDYCTSDITVTSAKTGSLTVHQCNKGVWSDELCMYNSFYGANRAFMPIYQDNNGKYQHDQAGDATEVILDLAEGQGWDSGRDIKLKVVEVRTNAGKGTLGQHDLALVGRGANATAIAALAAGDEVTLKYTWTYNPGTEQEVTPLVEQAVGGNALVMRGGELTEHNTNEAYNKQVYSRTGYGCSADGKMLYIVVIDKSTDLVYGNSAGCNTSVMCEFARSLGCSNMANFDAGGSAEMMVNGRIENKTTEGSPRNVANGWLVYSIAPENDDDARTVGKLAFDEISLQAPIYGQFSPKVIAYNKYGAVLDYDYKDYTLSCDASLGSCDGNTFTAGANAGKGTLTASCGDVKVEGTVEVVQSDIALRLKPLLIDSFREYPVEVTANIGNTVYTYDPASIEWTVEDPEIVSIDAKGVLRGLREGTTAYTGKIGEYTDRAEVTVEVAPAAEVDLSDFSVWGVKSSSGISNDKLSADGLYTFSYASPRDPYVGLTGPVAFYSLPDALYMEFTSDLPVRYVSVDMRSPLHTKLNQVNIRTADEQPFAAGTKHLVELPLSELGGPADIGIYPVRLNFIRFYFQASTDHKGDHSVRIDRLYGKYDHFASGVDLVSAGNAAKSATVTPNPVEAGAQLTVSGKAISKVYVFSTSGVLLSTVDGDGADTLAISAPAAAGAYVAQVYTADGMTASVIIVK